MRTLFGFWCLVLAALASGALAQDAYPNKAITLVVPVPPGGAADFIARLIGQKLSPFDAACLAVHTHGKAGDLAARKVGQISLMATDLLAALPDAFRQG